MVSADGGSAVWEGCSGGDRGWSWETRQLCLGKKGCGAEAAHRRGGAWGGEQAADCRSFGVDSRLSDLDGGPVEQTLVWFNGFFYLLFNVGELVFNGQVFHRA